MTSSNIFSGGALTVVGALFVILFVLRRRGLNFSLLILGALIAGVVVGAAFQGYTDWINPVGKVYVSVLNALVIPLIMVSILSSVTSLGSVARLKGIGTKSAFWLLTTTALSIILTLGLALALGIGRGSGLSIAGVNAANYQGALSSFSQVFVGMFPRNLVSDMNEENIVPIILFSVLMAVAYVLAAEDNAEKVKPFKDGVEAIKTVIFKAVGFVIELTPYAVLALTATVTSNGLSNLDVMWSLLALLIFSFVAFGIDTWIVNAVLLKAAAGLNPVRFFRKILPAQMVGFSTQSSAGTLPLTTRILTEEIGVAPSVANFTASLGTTIGMPGCSGIWPILVAVYGIHGLGLSYGPREYALLAVFSLIVSLGTAGVPGTSTIVTAGVLTAAGLPLEILVLVLPISAIADTGRTATNITAAMVASAIVARQEGVLDDAIFEGRSHEDTLPSVTRAPLPAQPAEDPAHVGQAAAVALPPEFAVGESCPL